MKNFVPGISKKLIFRCVALLYCIASFSTCSPTFAQRGTYLQTQSASTTNIHKAKLNANVGMRILYDWTDLEPTKGGYDFSGLLADVQRVVDSGLYIMLQVQSGQGSPITPPHNWLVTVDGLRTYITDDDNFPGPYPDYYDAAYKTAFYKLHDTLSKALAALPSLTKAKIIGVFGGVGSTGDANPHKGTPIGSSYGIMNGPTWTAFMKVDWDTLYAKYHRQNINTCYNPSNDAENLTYLVNRFPGARMKHGDPTHTYATDQEATNLFWPAVDYFGEVQGPVNVSSHLNNEGWALITSARGLMQTEIDMNAPFTDVAYKWMADWFTDHAYDEVNNKQGFCKLADKISYDSIQRFTELAYGNLIATGSTTAYNTAITNINNNSSYDELYKKVLRVRKVEQYVNATRVSNILAYANSIGATDDRADNYYNDVGYSMSNNYDVNVTQKVSNETSIGGYREGPDTSRYGRFTRKFKIVGGKATMYFDINDALGGYGNKIQIDIVYLDEGTGAWSVNCYKCGTRPVYSQTNTNTHLFKTATMTISNFKFGNMLPNGSDFTIKYISGANTSFDYINVKNINKP